MRYRLLALDLDGTLLRRDGCVDDRDIAAIAELQAAGVTVTIVTGRLHSGATGAARACAIEGAIACVEGSHLIEIASGRTLVHHGMSDDMAAVVRRAIVDHRLTSFVFDATGIHHEHAVAAAHDAVRPHADRIFSVSFPIHAEPGKHALMVRAAGPTKGTALAELCQRAGCSLAEAVAVGDWVNDVPMFEVAGRSFAMGTAPDIVSSKATDLLSHTAEAGGGIAEAIRRAWG